MINIEHVLNSNRSMKAATGMSSSEFTQMVESFDQELQNERWMEYEKGVEQGNRERKPGGGRIGNLKTTIEKLFFYSILFQMLPNF
jgi:hypothetical protein